MGIFDGLIRAAIAPVEIALKTTVDFFDYDENDEMNGVDIATYGATRVIRKGIKNIDDSIDGVIDAFKKD